MPSNAVLNPAIRRLPFLPEAKLLLQALFELPGLLQQLISADLFLFRKLERPFVRVHRPCGDKYLGEKVKWKRIVPGRFEFAVGLERFKTVFANRDIVIAVPVKRSRDGRDAYLLVVQDYQGALRLGVYRKPSLNTTAGCEQKQKRDDKAQ